MLRYTILLLFCIYKPSIQSSEIFPAIVVDPKNPSLSQKMTRVKPLIGNDESYAGYFQVPKRGEHFFWFFRYKVLQTPLIIWLQGQPGVSSLYSFFYENGPYQLGVNSTFLKRKFAWTNYYHVLYLDPTTKCGFSHKVEGEIFKWNVERLHRIGIDLYHILLQFFTTFPEFKDVDVYLAGASTASRTIPFISEHILNGNKNEGSIHIKLNGFIVGGGLLFGVDDFVSYVENYLRLGLIDVNTIANMDHTLRLTGPLIRSHSLEDVRDILSTQLILRLQKLGFQTTYDIRSENIDTEIYEVVTTPSFRNRIHAGKHQFKRHSDESVVYVLEPACTILAELLKKTRILFYNAQFDLVAPYSKTVEYFSQLRWEGLVNYYHEPKKLWYLRDQFIGHWKTAHNLTHVFIRNAGHMVGTTQPEALLRLVQKFISNDFP